MPKYFNFCLFFAVGIALTHCSYQPSLEDNCDAGHCELADISSTYDGCLIDFKGGGQFMTLQKCMKNAALNAMSSDTSIEKNIEKAKSNGFKDYEIEDFLDYLVDSANGICQANGVVDREICRATLYTRVNEYLHTLPQHQKSIEKPMLKRKTSNMHLNNLLYATNGFFYEDNSRRGPWILFWQHVNQRAIESKSDIEILGFLENFYHEIAKERKLIDDNLNRIVHDHAIDYRIDDFCKWGLGLNLDLGHTQNAIDYWTCKASLTETLLQ